MPSSARLDKETEEALEKTTRRLGSTKSWVVRESVKEYCRKVLSEKPPAPWDVYNRIHETGGSGHGKRVLLGKETLRKKLKADRKRWSS